MIHHHSSGKRRLWKRIFSMCIALILICGMTVPASSVSASNDADDAAGSAPVAVYEFFVAGSQYDSQTIEDGGTLTEPEAPTMEGKVFDGWYTSEEGGEKFTDFGPKTVTENVTVGLYAGWQTYESGDSTEPNVTEEPSSDEEPGQTEPEEVTENGTEPAKETGNTVPEEEADETVLEEEPGENGLQPGKTEDESSELTYVQNAKAALALYGADNAFRAGETIEDSYFTISGIPADIEVPDFTIMAGDISADSVPSIEGYDFVNATVGDDNIEVVSVGVLTMDEVTYVYYTTAGSASGLAAMVLGQNETIKLNYELHRNVYDISYEIAGEAGSATADSVFGTDRPVAVAEDDSYAFRVTIPRGYEAVVSVNGEEQGKLGVEPTYAGDNSTIWTVGEPAELTLNGTFEVTEVKEAQQVTVRLTRRTSYDFSAELWTKTRYASDNNGTSPRADFEPSKGSFTAENLEGQNQRTVWEFTTNNYTTNAWGTSGTIWILDGLQINGTDLEVPYLDNNAYNRSSRSTTVLPSGTIVTLTVTVNYTTSGWFGSTKTLNRTYTISVSNCYEDLTITGGNLNASSWTEIMVNRLTGVEFQIFDRQTEATTYNSWKTLEQSEPFGVSEASSQDSWRKNYWFGYNELRYRLLPGYVNPTITYGTAAGIEQDDLGHLVGTVSGPDEDGWYTFSINGQGNETFTMLRIEAEIGYYDVNYHKGVYAVETDGEPVLPPYDNGGYNIVNNSQILISSQIPVDNTNKNVFDYWTLEGYVDSEGEPVPIYPNELLNLADVAEYAVDGVLPLTAHWLDATQAEQITYDIYFVLTDEGGIETERAHIGTYNAPKGSTIVLDTDADEIKEFLEEHTDYVLDEETTNRYYANIQQGDELLVYFTKAVTDVTLVKNVEGLLGDVQKEFNFELYIENVSQGTFSLSDDETKTFEDVKIGDTIKFRETDATGYTVTVSYTSENQITAKEITADQDGYYAVEAEKGLCITVKNYKDATPDTGVHLTAWPYVMMLAFVGAGVVTYGVYKSRKRGA